MGAAVKLCATAVYLLYMFDIIEAHIRCKAPNGVTGICVAIEDCEPFMKFDYRQYKRPHENIYFQQSLCGGPGVPKFFVCCPPSSIQKKIDTTSILFPHDTEITSTQIRNKTVVPKVETPAPVPEILKIPPSNGIVQKPYPNEEEDLGKDCGIENSSDSKIYGSETTVSIDQYPWMALLEYSGKKLGCGGSLINHKYVLTAAHCVDDAGFGRPLFVRLAEYNTTSYPTDSVQLPGGGYDNLTVDIIPVKASFPHPRFARLHAFNDIGLVLLAKRANLTSDFIKVICLPLRDMMPMFDTSTNFTVAGWGATETKTQSDVKLAIIIPYVPLDKCGKKKNVPQICAGGVRGKDSCNGDSGGPLMYVDDDRYYAVGVISKGPAVCGTEGSPATHTNVYSYISWIKETMSNNN